VKFHPDGTCIASGSMDKSIKIWDIRSQRLIQHYDAHSSQVNEIDFHPNGRYLLSSSNDSTLKIWDLRQGHILYTLYGHEGSSTSASFSPCGDYFTTGGSDAVVMVWKSNLDENEQEFIEDFGAKTGNNDTAVPRAAPRAPTRNTTAKKGANASPTKSVHQTAQQSVMDHPYEADGGEGIGGSGEELAQTLEKVVSQLDIITRTLHVLEQRVSMNEESVSQCMSYFQELHKIRSAREHVPISTNIGHNDAQGHVINVTGANSGGYLSFN
jgi:centriolar protein POC1